MDQGMNSLLKWSIENSGAGKNPEHPSPTPIKGLDAAALQRLMGGPSDADLMKEAMLVIQNPEATLENRVVAFDNFEQLVENIDNANNLESLGLWTPLVGQLDSADADMRRMASWCIGTAVQNNIKAQERMLVVGAFPKVTRVAVEDKDSTVRRKAVYALSSGIRNYQPGLDEMLKHVPSDVVATDDLDATNMDAIDDMMAKLRDRHP